MNQASVELVNCTCAQWFVFENWFYICPWVHFISPKRPLQNPRRVSSLTVQVHIIQSACQGRSLLMRLRPFLSHMFTWHGFRITRNTCLTNEIDLSG